MRRVSFTTNTLSQAESQLAKTSTEDATQETVGYNISEQEIAKAKPGSNFELQNTIPHHTFITSKENTHCLVVEEEQDMNQYLTNCGYQCYRLTHRNADSGAANGLLTKIKNRKFCVC